MWDYVSYPGDARVTSRVAIHKDMHSIGQSSKETSGTSVHPENACLRKYNINLNILKTAFLLQKTENTAICQKLPLISVGMIIWHTLSVGRDVTEASGSRISRTGSSKGKHCCWILILLYRLQQKGWICLFCAGKMKRRPEDIIKPGTPGVREKKKLDDEGKRQCRQCNSTLQGSQRAEQCEKCVQNEQKQKRATIKMWWKYLLFIQRIRSSVEESIVEGQRTV